VVTRRYSGAFDDAAVAAGAVAWICVDSELATDTAAE
jgi:hypothetical protein